MKIRGNEIALGVLFFLGIRAEMFVSETPDARQSGGLWSGLNRSVGERTAQSLSMNNDASADKFVTLDFRLVLSNRIIHFI